jgi:hypothetical protein
MNRKARGCLTRQAGSRSGVGPGSAGLSGGFTGGQQGGMDLPPVGLPWGPAGGRAVQNGTCRCGGSRSWSESGSRNCSGIFAEVEATSESGRRRRTSTGWFGPGKRLGMLASGFGPNLWGALLGAWRGRHPQSGRTTGRFCPCGCSEGATMLVMWQRLRKGCGRSPKHALKHPNLPGNRLEPAYSSPPIADAAD